MGQQNDEIKICRSEVKNMPTTMCMKIVGERRIYAESKRNVKTIR
jgi:hypothetical protein